MPCLSPNSRRIVRLSSCRTRACSIVALHPGQHPRAIERIGTRLGGFLPARMRQHSAQPFPPFAQMPPCPPEPLQGRSQSQPFLACFRVLACLPRTR